MTFFLAFASAFSHFTAKNENGRKKPWFIVRESKPKHLYTVTQSYFRMEFTYLAIFSHLIDISVKEINTITYNSRIYHTGSLERNRRKV